MNQNELKFNGEQLRCTMHCMLTVSVWTSYWEQSTQKTSHFYWKKNKHTTHSNSPPSLVLIPRSRYWSSWPKLNPVYWFLFTILLANIEVYWLSYGKSNQRYMIMVPGIPEDPVNLQNDHELVTNHMKNHLTSFSKSVFIFYSVKCMLYYCSLWPFPSGSSSIQTGHSKWQPLVHGAPWVYSLLPAPETRLKQRLCKRL